jgi:tetratricopeptide (TPR) repeat protein
VRQLVTNFCPEILSLFARFTAAVSYTCLIGCAHLDLPDVSEYEHLPVSHAISGLPYFPQEADQCGPASLATMLGARDIAVTPDDLRAKVYIPEKKGSLTTELVAQARQHGLIVYRLRRELTDVFSEISHNNPVLVLENLGFSWFPRWHFSVVIGYDLAESTISLRSGDHLSYDANLALFQKTWRRAKSWAVVITDPKVLPWTAENVRFVNSANQLEQVGETTAALEAYQAALDQWPNSTLALFGAGNTSYELVQYHQASEYFSAYIEQTPDSAAGWNNLAYSLMKQSCESAASSAMACALQLAPDNTEFIDSHNELSGLVGQTSQRSCQIPSCPVPVL